MSAIAGMNPPPPLCQAPLGSLASPSRLQGHRLSAAASSPGHGVSVQENSYNNKNYPESSPDPEEGAESREEPSPAPREDPEHRNQFENNTANHENNDGSETPEAKDATLEPESDDELFMNEGPSLDDDDEEDSFQETSTAFPRDPHFDDSSNFVDEEDTTFGSPGLREAFTDNGFGNGAADAEAERSRAGSAETGRRNRRKQFKPRSIVSRLEAEEEAEEGSKSMTAGGEESPLSDYRRSLLPGAERDGSPMDLSAGPRVEGPESDSGSERSEEPARPRPGLSLVRPEILFGENKPLQEADRMMMAEAQPSPLSLLSSLSDLAPKADGSISSTMANTMKDAFREVLKLYGVSSDMAENIMGGGQGIAEKPDMVEPPGQSLRPLHPGMLSAALQGLPASLPPGHQPPTPPRTPQGHHNKHADPQHSLSMLPKMPSLLSMAALQQQMLGKPPGGLPGAAHMNKHGLQGLPPPMLGSHPMAGLPPLPPGLLAAQRVGMMPGQTRVTDYTRYFKRLGSSLECGAASCKDMNYREHWHCIVPMCKGKDFAKKEEMIRHSKWHQKMDEAFKYGFRRVTPMDDCSDQFQECSHNKKQTHYHCIQSEGCDKVYISTSDVQMHFNYHRKDNAIQREGFLRFRGAEDCHTAHCLYRGQSQRTTHFHCNRSSCQFTFKNKADMEKHKNYHMKDEQLNKDGFKKFMKHEPCGFLNCKFSRTHNHIHCIRSHCEYVLHSSGQLFSHKRKHERKDNELAYRKYKLAQSMLGAPGQPGPAPNTFPFSSPSPDLDLQLAPGDPRPPSSNGSLTSGSSTPPVGGGLAQPLPPTHAFPPGVQPHQAVPEDVWQQYLLRFDSEEGCGFQECEVEDTEHFHCKDEGCETVFRTEEGVREHGRNHWQQDHISDTFFSKVDPEEPGTESACPAHCLHRGKEPHFHCKFDQCSEVILSTDVPFRRLDHYKIHEYTKKWNMGQRRDPEPVMMTMTNNIDTMFKRKRGRPPKNRVIEFGGGTSTSPGVPQAVFTSFKLPKPGTGPSLSDFPGAAFSSANMNLGLTNSPFSFSVSPLRPPVPHFTTTTQFDIKPPQGPEVSGINPGAAEDPAPTAPQPGQEEIQKVQESNNNNQSENESSSDDVTPPKNQGLIKARGTYFPLTAFPTSMPQGSVMRSTDSPPGGETAGPVDDASPPISMKSKIGVNFLVSVGRSPDNGDNALAKLLQASQEMGFANSDKVDANPGKHLSSPPALSPLPERQQAGSPGRQAGSPSPSRMLSPSAQSPRLLHSSSPISVPTSPSSASLTHPSALPFANPFMPGGMNAAAQRFQHLAQNPAAGLLPPGINPFFPHAGMMLPGGLTNPFQRFPADPRLQPGAHLFDPAKQFARPGWPGGLGGPQKRSAFDDDESGMTMDQKKLRLQTSMRMLKDEPVPEGYMRFRFNEDCQFSNCNYREHQTHFHCMRKDCNYRFCDKTRFVQHTARHERLDTLCGDEFQGFRGVSCQREDCELNVLHNTSANQKSSSHFHCLKCDYYCTDTNKVVAHRRQHQKLDSIMAAGFEKFTPTQYCSTPGCSHNGKQTHYHCRKCQYAVLGLSQMEAHKYRHLNE